MNSDGYAVAFADTIFLGRLGAALGKPKMSEGLAKAVKKGAELRQLKGHLPWRQFIKDRGVAVYGFPMPGHAVNSLLDLNGPPVIVVDNSVPERCQDVATVKQYLHLELDHVKRSPDALQNIEANIGAYFATLPQGSDQKQREAYLKENPEMREVNDGLMMAGMTLLVIVGALVIGSFAKGVVKWVKAA